MKLDDLQISKTSEEFLEKHLEISGTSRGWAAACCPYHEDDRASFSINLSSGNWFCRGCDVKGKFKELVDKLGIRDFKPFPVARYVYESAAKQPKFVVVRYFPKTFRQFAVGADGLLSNNNPLALKILYRLPELIRTPKDTVIYLVEGEKDADTLHSLGYCATTNAGGANSWSSDHGKFLSGRRVVAIPDNDAAGESWLTKVRSSVKLFGILALPEGVKDVTDWILQGQKIESLPLEKTADVVVLNPLSELQTGFEVIVQNQKFPPIIKCGIAGLDAAGFFREGGIMAVGGRPSMGKSSLVAQLAGFIAKEKRCLVMPFEEDSETFIRRILLQEGVIKKIDDTYNPDEVREKVPQLENLKFMKENPTHIHKLKERLEAVLTEHQIDVVFLDHLQELCVSSAPSLHHAMTTILQVLKELRDKYHFTLIMALQLRRPDPRAGVPKMPEMTEARDSGTIEGVCWGMIMLHHPKYYDPNENDHIFLGVKKNRYGKRNLSVRLIWNEDRMKFEDAPAFDSWD